MFASDSPWPILRLVDERSDDPSKVTKADLHGDSYSTLETAPNIVAVPRSDQWYK